MDFVTISGLILTWLTILSIVGGFVVWAGKRNRRAIEVALKDVQDDLSALKRRHLRVLVYARKLYDVMRTEGLKPPEPPSEFYE
jgi:regulatory protein YycH of two-component signal transduction system YycFG